MLGFAPLSAAPLGDDAAPLPIIFARTASTLSFAPRSSAVLGSKGDVRIVLGLTAYLNAGASGAGVTLSGMTLTAAAQASSSPAISIAALILLHTSVEAGVQNNSHVDAEVSLGLTSEARAHIVSGMIGLQGLVGASVGRAAHYLRGIGRLELVGASDARAMHKARADSLWTFLSNFDARAVEHGSASRKLLITGGAQGAHKIAAEVSNDLAFSAQASGLTSVTIVAHVPFGTTSNLKVDLTSFAELRADLGFGLIARGKLLKSRLGSIIIPLSFAGEGHASLQTRCELSRSLAVNGSVGGQAHSFGQVASALTIFNGAELAVLSQALVSYGAPFSGFAAGAGFNRSSRSFQYINLSGAAQSRNKSTSSILGQLELNGSLRGAFATQGTVRQTSGLSGDTHLSLTSKGQVVLAFLAGLQGVGRIAPQALIKSKLSFIFSAKATVVVAPHLDQVSLLGGASSGGPSARITANSSFNLARSLEGRATVAMETARQIALIGEATAKCLSDVQLKRAKVSLIGVGTGWNQATARYIHQLLIFAQGLGRTDAVARALALKGLAADSAGQSPVMGASQAGLSYWANSGAQCFAQGRLASDFEIRTLGLANIAADLNSATILQVQSRASAQLQSLSDLAGQIFFMSFGDGKAKINLDLGRGFLTKGQSAVNVAHVAQAPLATLDFSGVASTKVRARLQGLPNFASYGRGTGYAIVQGRGEEHWVSTPKGNARITLRGGGLNLVQVLGLAVSKLDSAAWSLATLSLRQRLTAETATVAQIEDLTWSSVGSATGFSLSKAQVIGLATPILLDMVAFRAPPALGREATARLGLSGRLQPSNDVQRIS